MSTPDTTHHVATPAISQGVAFLRAAARQTTASTVRYSYGGSAISWSSEGEDRDDAVDRPTFEACSRAAIAAAERMVALAHRPRTMAVAIAYDECLDIITAAVNHMEGIDARDALHETATEAYQALRNIRELLRPSPHVRRALQF